MITILVQTGVNIIDGPPLACPSSHMEKPEA